MAQPRRRRLRFGLMLLGCSAALACTGTNFPLRVLGPERRPQADAVVRLAFVGGGACGAEVFWDTTDSTGTTRVQAEGCGEHLLVVASRGLQTERRVVDSCSARRLEIELQRVHPSPPPADPCARTALEFAHAFWTGDRARVDALVSPDAEVPDPAASHGSIEPWSISVISHERSIDTCNACVRLSYEHGCEPLYAIDLRADRNAWRVMGIGQGTRCPAK